MGEGVESGEGRAALRPQRRRSIEDLRDPLLHLERRQGDLEVGDLGEGQCLPRATMLNSIDLCLEIPGAKQVPQVAVKQQVPSRTNDAYVLIDVGSCVR